MIYLKRYLNLNCHLSAFIMLIEMIGLSLSCGSGGDSNEKGNSTNSQSLTIPVENKTSILSDTTASSVGQLKVEEKLYLANGIKIGEVAHNSAIIWTRITKFEKMNINGIPFPKPPERHDNGELGNLDDMEGSVPGRIGELRVGYCIKGSSKDITWTTWDKVTKENNYSKQFKLKNLQSATKYRLFVEARRHTDKGVRLLETKLKTAPSKETKETIKFTVVTGQDYPRRDDLEKGHRIYESMLKLNPNFFVHTGDIEYYDKPKPFAKNKKLARFKWNRVYALPNLVEFHNRIPSYFMKDDHDTLKNDCWPGQSYFDISWEDGLNLFKEQVPMGKKRIERFVGEKIYKSG